MDIRKEKFLIIITGLIIGAISVCLVILGNPANMGICIACFIRDTAGGLGLHQAKAVQYIRPEITGLVLGSFLIASFTKEFAPRGGSSPMTRFIVGFFVMIGALVFLGCPFRMILRLAGGDLNAMFGIFGFIFGISAGIFFLNRGYTLKRTYTLPAFEGISYSIIKIVVLILLLAAPPFIYFTEAGGGPGGSHAPVIASLCAGLIVGLLAQKTRLCMIGGIRDFILFKDSKLLIGFLSIFISALVMNLITGQFSLGFLDQPVSHTDGLWNFLGMATVGLGSALLGGCPLRQLVLAGEGNTDSAITLLGLLVGAAFAHNFGLASSAKGPTINGMIAVGIGLTVLLLIAITNTRKDEK